MASSPDKKHITKPIAGEPIPALHLQAVQVRHRAAAHRLLHAQFEASELSQADLAQMIHTTPDVVAAMLQDPSKLTLDLMARAIFALSGREITYSTTDPFAKRPDVAAAAQPPNNTKSAFFAKAAAIFAVVALGGAMLWNFISAPLTEAQKDLVAGCSDGRVPWQRMVRAMDASKFIVRENTKSAYIDARQWRSIDSRQKTSRALAIWCMRLDKHGATTFLRDSVTGDVLLSVVNGQILR